SWNIRRTHPERIDLAIIRRRRTRWWNGVAHGRNSSQVRHDRADVFLIPVRRVIPDHALPMQRAAISRDATPDRSRHCGITPSTNAGFAIRCDVASPQSTEWPPADFQSTATIRTVAERTRRNFEEIFAALNHRTLLAAER